MYIAISILIFIVCALLILIVLVQNSKGGGLSSSFASSNQIMGVRKTTDFLEKATWTLAGAMLVLCIVSAMVLPRGEQAGKKSAIQEQINTAAPGTQAIPDFGTMNNNFTRTRITIPRIDTRKCQYVSHTDIFLFGTNYALLQT